MIKKKNVFVAMSGGVDSSVAALLLQREGYDVTGVFMKNWSDPLAKVCPWKKDLKDFKSVCKVLKIPAKIEVFEEQYQKKIVNYLINEYKKGLTPNPDMLCNREIKFRLFLDKARKMGADMIATGHYVIKKLDKNGSYQLYQALDKNKDQSYFLALLNQKQLSFSLFPIGKYSKQQVRKIAYQSKLPVYNKKDSQGICFIGNIKFKNFIRQFIKFKPGLIKTTKGEVIGKHDGLAFYTIGQRHGLNIGGGIPYYVVNKKKSSNTLIVGVGKKDKYLFSDSLIANRFHWIESKKIKFPIICRARIRYRQPLQRCKVYKIGDHMYIKFNNKQRAITPGQFVVLYKDKKVLGGGIIK